MSAHPQTAPRYSFVLPIYNESENIPELHRRMDALLARLDGTAEVVLVDDGSADDSLRLLQTIRDSDPRYKIIAFARNFGHQIAITAGMDLTTGEAIIVLDADLQDPPEVVLEMIDRWKDGYEIVYAERIERQGESWFKRATADWFYKVQRRISDVDIPANVGDFRLVDRAALETFRQMRESNRYVRGMFAWIGLRQTRVQFVRAPRHAGKPQYTFWKSLRLALDALVGFSNAPLRLALSSGSVVSLFSLLYGLSAVGMKIAGATVPGWTSLAVLVSFLSGIQLLMLGVLGEYIGRIHEESKQRPLYIVRSLHGFEPIIAPRRAVVLSARPQQRRRMVLSVSAAKQRSTSKQDMPLRIPRGGLPRLGSAAERLIER